MYRCQNCCLVYALTDEQASEAREASMERSIECNHCGGQLEALTTSVGLDKTVTR